MQSKTTVIGFVIAPLIPALILGGLGVWSAGGAGWLLVLYVCAFAGMCVFALPLFLLLNAANMIRWWSCATSGLVVGGLIAWLIRLPNSVHFVDLLPFSGVGAISALCFWGVWSLGHDKGGEASRQGLP